MGLKSAWAYRNGERMMREVKSSLLDPKTGWIKRGDVYLYAERYEKTGKLMVKTYSNKKQCLKKIESLEEDCFMSDKHPFTINKN